MWLISHVTLGVYHDECEGIHPLTMEQYYGVHGHEQIRLNGQTGAGHPLDEDPEEGDEEIIADGHSGILERLEADIWVQVCHEAVEVPGKGSPFISVEDETKFWLVLDHVMLENTVLTWYGLLSEGDEIEGGESTLEHIPIGYHGTKYVTVSLAEPVWARRAKTWCQVLTVLTLFDASGYFNKQ